MGNQSRKEYLAAIRERYRKAGRKEKGRILAEFCAVCDYNRKYAIRILRRKSTPAKKKTGPKPKCDGVVVGHLKRLWLATDPIQAKREMFHQAWQAVTERHPDPA